jgi:oligosaccharide translocation protein RFT1
MLFLSREAFRRACMRSSVSSAQEIQKSVNVSWLSVPWGFILSALVTWGFLWLSNAEELSVPGYMASMWLIGLASAIEMLSEPAYILTQNLMFYRVRVAVEASAVLIRCICVYTCVTVLKVRFASRYRNKVSLFCIGLICASFLR